MLVDGADEENCGVVAGGSEADWNPVPDDWIPPATLEAVGIRIHAVAVTATITANIRRIFIASLQLRVGPDAVERKNQPTSQHAIRA
jgi:hypothetical protein